MLVPPGIITGLDTMEKLIDAYEVCTFLDQDIKASQNPWIKASLMRLKNVLHGKDPLIIEDDDAPDEMSL